MLEIAYKFRVTKSDYIRRVVTIGYGDKATTTAQTCFISIIDEYMDKHTFQCTWAEMLWRSDRPFKEIIKWLKA